VPGSLGSISALGTTAVLDLDTEFDDASCAQISALLIAGFGPIVVEIEILETAMGELRATEVELKRPDLDDDDDDDDDDDEDEDEDADDDEDEDGWNDEKDDE
jgi:hypothetical protein